MKICLSSLQLIKGIVSTELLHRMESICQGRKTPHTSHPVKGCDGVESKGQQCIKVYKLQDSKFHRNLKSKKLI